MCIRDSIFFRELVSNGCDAITKLKKLALIGEYTYPEDHKDSIRVIVNPEEKTLKFIDTGLGMTADEVEEYINPVSYTHLFTVCFFFFIAVYFFLTHLSNSSLTKYLMGTARYLNFQPGLPEGFHGA